MTTDRGLGPLGTRLFAAFLLVAVASVGTLSAAALIGTQQGIAAQETATRQATTDAIARSLAQAAASASTPGLVGIDSAEARALADAAGVRYLVRDGAGSVVASYRARAGMGMGMMQGQPTGRWMTSQIVIQGQAIGSVSVAFPTPLPSSGQTIAWTWILVAAVVALFVALLLAWFVSRRIAQPLLRISGAAQRFAEGDRSARTDPRDAAAGWELGELARAFDATADNVVRSETARRRVAADVAHELRTPLAVLQAGLEEVRDGLVIADGEHLAILHAQALRLGRIVEDLSSLAAAETAALSTHLEETDLAAIAAAALRDARPSLEAAGITATLEAPAAVPVRADVDRMHQAIANLLGNAARYCRRGDHVDISATSAGEGAVLQVADTGPGVPDDELPHLFERLWRGRGARAGDGSGIGLAVVRELVEAQRGVVTAERNDNGGLTFTVRLPHG